MFSPTQSLAGSLAWKIEQEEGYGDETPSFQVITRAEMALQLKEQAGEEERGAKE